MKSATKYLGLTIAITMIATKLLADDPIQAPEDLSKARKNILAGTVNKKESPVVGVSQKTVGPDDQADDQNDDQDQPTTGKKKSKKKSKPAYSYHDEKILNWIYMTNDMIAKENNPQASIRNVSFRGALDANKTSTPVLASASKNQVSSIGSLRINGVCTIPEEVSLAANSKGVLMAFCETKKGRYKLFGELTPKAEEYSLVAKPIYVEDTHGQRFYVDNNNSYVLNSKKNSYNIATFVNTYALDKVVRESIKDGSKNIAATSTQYMNDLKASRTQQQTVLVPNAGTTTSTNTQKPVASDYVTLLGIQMSADLVDKWADYAFQDHPWGFLILADTKIYMDLTLNTNSGGYKR